MSTTHVIENNKLLVRRLYEDCINRGNLALLTELISDEFVGSPGAQGAAEFGKGIAAVRNGFPDVQFEVEDLIAEGDRVAVRWTFRGTHGGPFAGRAASHVPVTLRMRMTMSDPEAACECAQMGLGIAWVSMPNALPFLQNKTLIRVLPDWYVDGGTLSLYFAAQKLLPAKTWVFVDYVVEHFRTQELARHFSAF
ncbi:ester cyclase [Collimonas antrihumi]|uniref:ester cyclase n=1 Tax=Collimonas antrihumi TaxID=1940615 RepID=UPI001B8AC43B|nr:ester cyclase [Collimonas antrihumi]